MGFAVLTRSFNKIPYGSNNAPPTQNGTIIRPVSPISMFGSLCYVYVPKRWASPAKPSTRDKRSTNVQCEVFLSDLVITRALCHSENILDCNMMCIIPVYSLHKNLTRA